VAAAVRTARPDLIVHLGDYHYRESPCAAPHICDDSPFGDTWPAWSADFFSPAATLLAVAPWVMLRGNHEDCSRAGAGWFYFLDPSDTVPPRGCNGSADGYVLNFDDLAMVVIDTAHAGDERNRKNRIKEYDDLLNRIYPQVAPTSGKELWLLVHQPLWSSFGDRDRKSDSLVEKYKGQAPLEGLQAALRNVKGCHDDGFKDCDPKDLLVALQSLVKVGDLKNCENGDLYDCDPQNPLDALRRRVVLGNLNGAKARISLVLSGDTHLFQFFGAEQPELPAQLVIGTGGDVLEPEPKYNSMLNPGGEEATLYKAKGRLWTRKMFGFVLLTRADPGPGWIATFYDMYGVPMIKCFLGGRSCR
jgi:hypothetical protein